MGLKEKPLTPRNLDNHDERVYKDHVKQGDTDLFNPIIEAAANEIWQKVLAFEAAADIRYIRPRTGADEDASWVDLGQLMSIVCMSATDAMIANSAISVGADAIVTTDCDYACLHDVLDIFMPLRIARQCRNYIEASDIAAAGF